MIENQYNLGWQVGKILYNFWSSFCQCCASGISGLICPYVGVCALQLCVQDQCHHLASRISVYFQWDNTSQHPTCTEGTNNISQVEVGLCPLSQCTAQQTLAVFAFMLSQKVFIKADLQLCMQKYHFKVTQTNARWRLKVNSIFCPLN